MDDSTLRNELILKAYESNFTLLQHYSSTLLQVRIAIISLTVAAVAAALGVFSDGDLTSVIVLGFTGRSILAYSAAVLLNLLHAMEVVYIKRFHQVIASGRVFERTYNVRSYLSRYDKSGVGPLHMAYLLGMVVLCLVFVSSVWVQYNRSMRVVVVVLALAPLAFFYWLFRRFRRMIEALLTDETAAPAT